MSKELHCEKWCDKFKDKSKIVELTCKVGDTVYIVTEPINVREYEDVFDGDIVFDDEWLSTPIVLDCYVESITHYAFKCSDQYRLTYRGSNVSVYITNENFGKTVFLTREEAERVRAEHENP